MADYMFLLESRLSPEQQALVARLQRLCQQAGLNLYLTGGPMRDLLAGGPIRTLDFTVEGNPLKLHKGLVAEGAEVRFAAEEEQSIRLRLRAVRFRITAAHTESFDRPGKPPEMRPAAIIEDLRRRGFTLDAIGLSLNPASRGLLLDPTNGLADIEARQIRMVHSYVFYEDPVRLLRAVRLRTRLGFALEERTAARAAAARENDYLAHAYRVSCGKELEAIAYEPDPAAVLKALELEGLLAPVYGPAVKTAKMNLAGLSRLSGAALELEDSGLTADSGPVALQFMIGELPAKEQVRLARLPMSKSLVSGWQTLPADAKALQKKLTAAKEPSLAQMHDWLHQTRPEVVLWVAATTSGPGQKRMKEFTTQLPRIRQQLPLRELQQWGLSPDSPKFHDVIQRIFRRLLESEAHSAADIRALLQEEADRAGARPAAGADSAAAPRAKSAAKLKAGRTGSGAAKPAAPPAAKAAPPRKKK
ncbi:MAG: hypothetical protein ACRD2E_07865 [Terriglobales bacterium]